MMRRDFLNHANGHHRKNQEAGWVFYILVDKLELSSEEVVGHKKLLLDAIKWYRTRVLDEKPWARLYISNVHVSLLPDLEKRIESGEKDNEAVSHLLADIVKKYRERLEELLKEDWVNTKTVGEQAEEADTLVRNHLS